MHCELGCSRCRHEESQFWGRVTCDALCSPKTMMLYALLLLALLQPARCFLMTVGAQQKQSVQQFDRRQLFGRCAAAAVTVSSVLGAAASVVHADEAVVAEEAVAARVFSETISYREFNRLLLDKSIKRASFYGTAFSNCIVERSDGVLVSEVYGCHSAVTHPCANE
jgi:hypothetical protein